MKKALLRKSIATAILLLILAFSATAINTPLVKADVGGKDLTIGIEGEGGGSVTATKVKSGDTWEFSWEDPPMTEKVGAGTFSLEAKASEGWDFSHWEGDLTGTSENPAEYKIKGKHGYVVAVFIKKTFTITANVAPEAPNGYIETIVDSNTIQITDIPIDVTVEYGDSQTFDFYPDEGNHTSAIKIESQIGSDFIVPAPSYTFTDVQEDWTIVVFFSADGEAYVPAGTDVPVDLGDGVSFLFYSTGGGGTATQEDLLLYLAEIDPELAETSLILLEVSIGVSFDIVKIALPYSGPTIEHVYWGDPDLLYSDVNADGVVDGDDVSDVANAIKSLTPNSPYNANCDADRDGDTDEDDIHLVNEYKGTSLQEIDEENFWVEDGILYIETELNRVFRGR